MNAWIRDNPRFLVPIAIVASLILIGLGYNVVFPKAIWQSRELEQYRTKWESQNIAHYRMSLDLPFYILKYGQLPVTVEVRDGNVVSMVDAQGRALSPEDVASITSSYPDGLTVPGLFAYALKTFWKRPPAIDVSYDPVLGYPSTIYVDPYVEPCCQEFTIEVRDFQVNP